jgi:hypothetical protein
LVDFLHLRRHFAAGVAMQDGTTPREVALQNGHADCARLLELNADADANNTVRIKRFASDLHAWSC